MLLATLKDSRVLVTIWSWHDPGRSRVDKGALALQLCKERRSVFPKHYNGEDVRPTPRTGLCDAARRLLARTRNTPRRFTGQAEDATSILVVQPTATAADQTAGVSRIQIRGQVPHIDGRNFYSLSFGSRHGIKKSVYRFCIETPTMWTLRPSVGVRPTRSSHSQVPRDVMERCLEAANWAPSHGKTEAWRFVVRNPIVLHYYTRGGLESD